MYTASCDARADLSGNIDIHNVQRLFLWSSYLELQTIQRLSPNSALTDQTKGGPPEMVTDQTKGGPSEMVTDQTKG